MDNADLVIVYCWGEVVGAVTPDPVTGFYAFEYDSGWMSHNIELSPLRMPNRSGAFVFPELGTKTFHRLPALLADAMPDRFGTALVDGYFSSRGTHRDEVGSLDRLLYMGNRSMGALEFMPAIMRDDGDPRSEIEVAALVGEARKAVRGIVDTEEGASETLRQLIQIGSSAGGARAKAVVAWNKKTRDLRSGQNDVDPGFEHWLLKFDGVGPDSELGGTANFGRIEAAYALMARAAGVDMTETELLEEGGRAHFMTKRFDRIGSLKLHVQTLCAIDHLDFDLTNVHDYGQYFSVADRLGLGPDARNQIFRRMVLNVAGVNYDDHTKNASFMCGPDGIWMLTPAYDVTHAYSVNGKYTSQHQMSVNGKFANITYADIVEVGDRYQVPGIKASIEAVVGAVESWGEFADAAGLPAADKDRIARDMAHLGVVGPRLVG